MAKLIGRKDLLEDLESLWRKRTSSIVACRGRRRIGKSTLIREFAGGQDAQVHRHLPSARSRGDREVTADASRGVFYLIAAIAKHRRVGALADAGVRKEPAIVRRRGRRRDSSKVLQLPR